MAVISRPHDDPQPTSADCQPRGRQARRDPGGNLSPEPVNQQRTNYGEDVDLSYWIQCMDDAERAESDFRKRGREVVEIYRNETAAGKGRVKVAGKTTFNILYANTEVLLGAVYQKPPQPVVRSRFASAKPVPMLPTAPMMGPAGPGGPPDALAGPAMAWRYSTAHPARRERRSINQRPSLERSRRPCPRCWHDGTASRPDGCTARPRSGNASDGSASARHNGGSNGRPTGDRCRLEVPPAPVGMPGGMMGLQPPAPAPSRRTSRRPPRSSRRRSKSSSTTSTATRRSRPPSRTCCLPGRGVCRVRWKPEMKTEPVTDPVMGGQLNLPGQPGTPQTPSARCGKRSTTNMCSGRTSSSTPFGRPRTATGSASATCSASRPSRMSSPATPNLTPSWRRQDQRPPGVDRRDCRQAHGRRRLRPNKTAGKLGGHRRKAMVWEVWDRIREPSSG